MRFLFRFLLKIAVAAGILYLLTQLSPHFLISGGTRELLIAAAVLTLCNIILRPVLRFLTTPIRWITLGLFGIVINIAILWLADQALPGLQITTFGTLLWSSLLIGLVNAFF